MLTPITTTKRNQLRPTTSTCHRDHDNNDKRGGSRRTGPRAPLGPQTAASATTSGRSGRSPRHLQQDYEHDGWTIRRLGGGPKRRRDVDVSSSIGKFFFHIPCNYLLMPIVFYRFFSYLLFFCIQNDRHVTTSLWCCDDWSSTQHTSRFPLRLPLPQWMTIGGSRRLCVSSHWYVFYSLFSLFTAFLDAIG
jgi:hypothetical protein